MDPNANLKELRTLVDKVHEQSQLDTLNSDDVYRLTELFGALDHWMSTGGYIPKVWQPRRPYLFT